MMYTLRDASASRSCPEYIAIKVLRDDLMEVFLVLLCVLQVMVEDEQYCVFTAWTKYL